LSHHSPQRDLEITDQLAGPNRQIVRTARSMSDWSRGRVLRTLFQ
jgi:hypothetical protein